MLHSLRLFTVLLASFLLGFTHLVNASHILGGQISYRYLGPGAPGTDRYAVTVMYFRDCTGVGFPTSLSLTALRGGCGATIRVMATLNIIGPVLTTNPYCGQVQAQTTCSVSSPFPLYEYQNFTGTVDLAPNAEWLLSVEDCCRPTTGNLIGQPVFRFEATLNTLLSISGTPQALPVRNNSPVFGLAPYYFLPWNRSTTFGNTTFDADGDSLVYELARPLESCGAATPTKPITWQTAPAQPGCTYTLAPGSPTTHSAAYPIATAFDTTGTCPQRILTPTPLLMDPATGSITLTPGRMINNPQLYGDNRYIMVVLVTEYRRLPGSNRRYRVGSVRRDLIVTVYNCGTNQMPRMGSIVTVSQGTQPQAQPLGQVIPAEAGETVSIDLTASDPNPGQLVEFSTEHNPTPGVTLRQTTPGQARLSFTPPPSLPDGLYHVLITVFDNACPVKGNESRVLTFRVFHTTLSGRKARTVELTAAPNPFRDQVQFQLPEARVQTLTIVDNLGRQVSQVTSQADGKVRWQPEAALPAGLYLARSADGKLTVRLLRSAAQ